MGETQPAVGVPSGLPASPLPGARTALILLLLINMFNYIDRQVLAAVEPEVRAVFLDHDDPHAQFWLSIKNNAKFWTGCLSMAFLVFYMCFAPLFGMLADRTSRWLLVAIGIGLWTVASGASGLATTFLVLLLTRCCVGIGEAVYGPVAPSVRVSVRPRSTPMTGLTFSEL